jgi:hypothetical protein
LLNLLTTIANFTKSQYWPQANYVSTKLMFQKFYQFWIGLLKLSCGNHVHFHNGPKIGTNETWNLRGHGFKVQLQIVCQMLCVHHLFFVKCVTNGRFNSKKVIKSITMLEKKTYLKFLKKIGQNTWVVTNIIGFFFRYIFFQKLQGKWEIWFESCVLN